MEIIKWKNRTLLASFSFSIYPHLLHLALNCLKINGYFGVGSRTNTHTSGSTCRTTGDTRALGDARRRILCKQSVASAERPRKRQE